MGYDIGIFENKSTGNYFWLDCLDEYEVEEVKYFCDEKNCSGFHSCKKSALYDDMDGYVDEVQEEESLADGELYIVTYFKFDECGWGLEQDVDFGITKQQIIENVNNQKYVEGASYFTIGQMFYTTSEYMKEKNR